MIIYLPGILLIQNPHADFTYTASNHSREFIFTNNSSNAESYLWDFGDAITSTDTNAVHSFASEGIYTITLTAANCDLSAMKQQSKQITIDLNPIVHATGVMVYPNPTKGYFTVKVPIASIGMNYRIIDALGRIIQRGNLDKELNEFNLSYVTSGIYILQIGNIKKKIVKY